MILIVLSVGCFSSNKIDVDTVGDEFTKVKRCMVWDGVLESKTYNCNNTICDPYFNETENITLTRDYIDWADMNRDIITASIEQESKEYSSASLNINLIEYSFDKIDYDMRVRLYNESYFGILTEYRNNFESTECIEYLEVFKKDEPFL